MAVGYTANLTTKAQADAQIGADAAYMRTIYDWLKRKYAEYNGNLVPQITAIYTVVGDQNIANTFIADLNRLINIFEGGTQATGENIVNDIAVCLGIQV